MKGRTRFQYAKHFPFRYCVRSVVFIIFVSIFAGTNAFAAPIHSDQARRAAIGWLRLHPRPMESRISRTLTEIVPIGQADQPLGFVVRLESSGFIVLSAEDRIEPLIAFSPNGRIDVHPGNPLRILLEQDLAARFAQVQAADGLVPPPADSADSDSPQSRWQQLLEAGAEVAPDDEIQAKSLPSVSDLRVPPLVQTQWSQEDAAGDYCYNYYTPNHFPTGCVATAMAQLMRYHSFPTAGIGVKTFQISVNGVPQNRNTRGGNGSGGPYYWDRMVFDPSSGLTDQQRQAIGALCYDAGLSVNMDYTADGSGASTATADEVLVSTFGYANSIYADFSVSGLTDALKKMINSNLDASLPVIVSISGPGVGHAAIADGYGLSDGTMYHHMNFGWAGLEDAWYQLPPITNPYYFNVIDGCVYNVYTSGIGEIISGRIINRAGTPLESVQVTAYLGSTAAKQTSTNSRGIYALKNLASNTQYRISVVKTGFTFSDQFVTTGKSQDWNASSGNRWAIDFAATNSQPPTALDRQVSAPSQQPVLIGLQALDDHLPNPPGKLSYTIVSLPEHGTLSEPNVATIHSIPYTLTTDSNEVRYTPCPYFGGADTFHFKANDGGTAPTGGDSNIAAVTVTVDNTLTSNFGIDNNWSTNTMIDTTYYASRSQVLYRKSDIGPTKILTDLAIHFTGKPPIPLTKWTIRMQHTNMTGYDDVVADFLTTGWTTVYQSDVTVSKTGWLNFHFTTPFKYNGTQNLLIDFSFNNSSVSGDTGWYLYQDVGAVPDRMITIVTNKSSHSDPLTWDFWYGDGYYWGGGWLPSVKLIGIVPIDPILGDFDASCDVKLPDFARMAAAWNTSLGNMHYDSACDIAAPKNNKIDLADLKVLASRWLSKYPAW